MREVQSYQFVPLWWEIMTISQTKTNPWQKRSRKSEIGLKFDKESQKGLEVYLVIS